MVVTNTDDFLIRMVKGCIQLGQTPNIHNTVNMVPVDHVARVVVASAFYPPATPLAVAQVTSHPRLRFNEFLSTLSTFGYNIEITDYIPWRIALEKHVMENKENALYPLLHFVTDNLPTSTKAPELDDLNARKCLEKWDGGRWKDGSGVDVQMMGVYLGYLVALGFLPMPSGKGEMELPQVKISQETKAALGEVGGRGAMG